MKPRSQFSKGAVARQKPSPACHHLAHDNAVPTQFSPCQSQWISLGDRSARMRAVLSRVQSVFAAVGATISHHGDEHHPHSSCPDPKRDRHTHGQRRALGEIGVFFTVTSLEPKWPLGMNSGARCLPL